jgi:hypothetical protein
MRFEVRHPPPGENVNVSRVNPVREALLLFAGMVAVATALLLALGLLAEAALTRIPPSIEARTFGGLWDQLDARAGAAERDQARALQPLLERIASHWKDCPHQLRVGVLESSELNAFALPGGLVLVTTALLESAESENEVAFVLGHELGHHYLGHLPCTAKGSVSAADVGRVLSSTVPLFNQPNELASDVAGTNNVLDAGARRQGYKWTEGGGLLTMQIFGGLDQFSATDIVFGFERSHPPPQIRTPVIQQTAGTWRSSGGKPPFWPMPL